MKNNKLGTVISWIYFVLCIFMLIAYGFNLGTVVFALIGISALPIKPIKDLWKKIPINKNWFKPVVLGVMFFVAALLIPSEALQQAGNSSVSGNVSKETQSGTVSKDNEYTSLETEEGSSEQSTNIKEENPTQPQVSTVPQITISDIPTYSEKSYVAINNNVPGFTEAELSTTSYEFYSELDSLGRCGVVYACIGKDIMPTEERGSIGQVKPTGWHTVKYDIVDGNYLYNRCHLIGYQLTGENANTKNLITGTRSMNVDGMLPFENMVADYVKETGNHVMYRVTPVFEGNNLLASGVQIEAKSVEDNGAGILFNVYCYNVQDGVTIDYATGDSKLDNTSTDSSNSSESVANTNTSEKTESTSKPVQSQEPTVSGRNFVVNGNNGKIHMVGECSATGSGSNAMNNPVYFNTYEEAEAYSIQIAPKQDKRKCGNCW